METAKKTILKIHLEKKSVILLKKNNKVFSKSEKEKWKSFLFQKQYKYVNLER